MENRINQDTGLYQWPLFELLFGHEIARARRYPSPLCLLHLSMWGNGKVSPERAESAVMHVAHVLNSSLRQVDVPAHYNDDFLILLPVTDEEGGLTVARRLIERISGEHTARTGSRYFISVCVGMTSHVGGALISGPDLLQQAAESKDEAIRLGPNTLMNYRDLALIRA